MLNTKDLKINSRKLINIIALCGVVLSIVLGVLLFRKSTGSSVPKLTSDLISQRLEQVSEIASVKYYYTNVAKFEDSKDFYGWTVPLTTKSFIVSYDGIITAGIDASEVSVETDGRAIIITIPAAKILSHEIDEKSITVFDEYSSIFNMIRITDYVGFSNDQKVSAQQRAIDKGLLEEAGKNAETALRKLFDAFGGEYTITIKTAGT